MQTEEEALAESACYQEYLELSKQLSDGQLMYVHLKCSAFDDPMAKDWVNMKKWERNLAIIKHLKRIVDEYETTKKSD